MLSQSSLTSALTPSVTFFYMSAWEKTFTLKSLNTAIFKQVCLKSLLFSQFRSFSLQQLLTSLKRCIRFFLNCYTFTSLSPCQWLWSALPAGQPCPLQTESRCVDGPSSPSSGKMWSSSWLCDSLCTHSSPPGHSSRTSDWWWSQWFQCPS